MAHPKDIAFGGGQKAAWEGTPRFNNPYENQTLKRLWWAGWDSANRAKAQQAVKGVGKY